MNSALKASRKKPKLTLIFLYSIGILLFLLLATVFTFIVVNQENRINKEIRDKSDRILLSIEAIHTQSMIYRDNENDTNPVIQSMDDAFKQLAESQKNVNIWLAMGPKLLTYQLKNGAGQEPPKDDVDRAALQTGQTVARFIDNRLFRLSRPVILGQGNANHPICFSCHEKHMGIRQDEVIGTVSISYDTTDTFAEFDYFRQKLIVIFLLILFTVLGGIYYIFRSFVGQPILEISKIMKKIGEGQENVQIPESGTSQELNRIIAATHIFQSFAKTKTRELQLQKSALDEHAIVSITDAEGNIIYSNEKFSCISKYSHEELLGQNHRIVKSNDTPPELYQDLWQTITNGKPWHGEIKNKTKDREDYWVETSIVPFMDSQGKIFQYVSILTDITKLKENEESLKKNKLELETLIEDLDTSKEYLEEQAQDLVILAEDKEILNMQLQKEIRIRIAAEEKLLFTAHHDQLTGLPNRRLFYELATQALESAKRNNLIRIILFIDIDGFKTINDTLGHRAGDQLLQKIAERLNDRIRKSDIIARFGGDEFVIFLVEECDITGAELIADEIIRALSEPFDLESGKATVGASIGIALFPDHGTTIDDLLKNSDAAMYVAKNSGKNIYKIFKRK